MKALIPVMYLGATIVVGSTFSVTVNAAERVQGGTIHFYGSIVEEPCEVSQNNEARQLTMNCAYQGKTATRTVSLSDIERTRIQPIKNVSVQLHYVDQQKKLAVMEMNYN